MVKLQDCITYFRQTDLVGAEHTQVSEQKSLAHLHTGKNDMRPTSAGVSKQLDQVLLQHHITLIPVTIRPPANELPVVS